MAQPTKTFCGDGSTPGIINAREGETREFLRWSWGAAAPSGHSHMNVVDDNSSVYLSLRFLDSPSSCEKRQFSAPTWTSIGRSPSRSPLCTPFDSPSCSPFASPLCTPVTSPRNSEDRSSKFVDAKYQLKTIQECFSELSVSSEEQYPFDAPCCSPFASPQNSPIVSPRNRIDSSPSYGIDNNSQPSRQSYRGLLRRFQRWDNLNILEQNSEEERDEESSEEEENSSNCMSLIVPNIYRHRRPAICLGT